MNKPLLSVLMPVYNSEKHLREAIESVLNQTFRDFEFLIIDDGSTDQSSSIAQSYTDARIRFYRNEKNLGIKDTLNKGIALARAAYIARMDADDVCFPERLQKQHAFIQQHPDGALFSCWATEVTEEGKFIRTDRLPPEHYYYNLTFACSIYHPTMVYRRDAVLAVGGYTVPYAEDFELVWQLMRRYKIYHLPEVLLQYRISGQSLWQVTKKQENKLYFLRQVRRNISFYLNNKNVPLEDWQLEFLSYYHDEAFFKTMNTRKVIAGIKLLDAITKGIINTDNVNRNSNAIKAAARKKKHYTLTLYSKKFGPFRGIQLLARTNNWNLIAGQVSEKLKAVMKL